MPQQETKGPALVLVSRVASGPPAVPSDTIICGLCGQDCWLSQYSGASTIATARLAAGGAEPLICCQVCLHETMAQATAESKTLEAVIAERTSDNK